MKQVTLGHTPDADDAFMFYGIASGKISSPYFEIKHVIEDIEKLNKRAINHDLDITAISAHAYAFIKDYVILNSGGSFWNQLWSHCNFEKEYRNITTEQMQDRNSGQNDIGKSITKSGHRKI